MSPKREEAGALHEAERGLNIEEAYLLLAQPPPTTCYYRREATAAAAPTIMVVSTTTALAHAMHECLLHSQFNTHTGGSPAETSQIKSSHDASLNNENP